MSSTETTFNLKAAIIGGAALASLAVLTDFICDQTTDAAKEYGTRSMQVYGYKFIGHGTCIATFTASVYYITQLFDL